jgi:hypothetical protein
VVTPPHLFENFVNNHENYHFGKLKTRQERDFEEQQDSLTFAKYEKRTKKSKGFLQPALPLAFLTNYTPC